MLGATGLVACVPGPSFPDGMFGVYLTEPENPLIPANTTENQGSMVVNALWTPLVTFDKQSKDVTYEGVAESVTSRDNQTWTISLKQGWTFHDGSPLTAGSYVRSWNHAALSTSAFGGSYFFSNIEGYEDLQAKEGAEPAATEMSGLRAVDDHTIEVRLTKPFAIYPLTLGYHAFDPLPEAYYADPDAFGKKPIGTGPFMADTEWTVGRGMTVRRYDDYQGPDKAKSEGVVFQVYTELNTGYTDVMAGNLDLLKDLPPDALANAEDVFEDRYAEQPRPDITSLGFPLYDQRFDDVRVRRAISMAIDREAITEAIFFGTRVPADSFGSPVVEGYRSGACGEWCTYDPDRARDLLNEANFDFSEPVDLWFNGGAGHDSWMTAVGNLLRKVGITYRLQGNLQFADFLGKRDAKEITGPFRDGWIMDYPSLYSFLSGQYSTAALAPAGSNTSFYSSPDFDAALEAGDAAATIDEATADYQRAEDMLITDLPATPLFYGLDQAVWTPRLSNVAFDIKGEVILADITVDGVEVTR